MDHDLRVDTGVAIVGGAFDDWARAFGELTAHARFHFERRQWRDGQRDSVGRLALYEPAVKQAVAALARAFGRADRARPIWPGVKAGYLSRVSGGSDADLAITFFSSVARRFFETVGVDAQIEFLEAPLAPAPDVDGGRVVRRFECRGTVRALVADVLEAYRFGVAYEDLERDSRLAAEEILRHAAEADVRAIELARAVFYRNKAAYLVGRLHTASGWLPLAIALLNDDAHDGVTVDAMLLTEDDVSMVFSYTRSYFSVATDDPRELVAFLRQVLPRKPVADLFTAIGHHKRAKTELYRALRLHLAQTADLLDFTPGQPGMVMIVFAMPSADVVFKVFRDRFAQPKMVTHELVKQKYQLVFEHDRAGRLVDAQEFTDLEFDRARFADGLLEELRTQATGVVSIGERSVVLRHVYTERRVTPLDVYLKDAPEDHAVRAVLDYGAAVRDLAATNIFPGDLLLKNFGLTRHGRVVFYDYDEISLVTECVFRRFPPARSPDEEMAPTPWFAVGENDVFPEEFESFLGLTGATRAAFIAHYWYLLDADFWRHMQRELRAGAVVDIFPYASSKRLLTARLSTGSH